MTDFCLIYKESGSSLDFMARGVSPEGAPVPCFQIEIPNEMKAACTAEEIANCERILANLGTYLQSFRMHQNVRIEKFVSAAR